MTVPRSPGRLGRAASLWLGVSMLVVGCAPDDSPTAVLRPETSSSATVAPSGDETGDAEIASDATVADPPMGNAAASDGPATVDVTAAWSGTPALPDGTADYGAVIEPGVGNPFGRLGSCSGTRAHIGAYSVFVSEAPGSAIAVWTSDRVVEPGIYDAEVRLERDGAIVDASGTVEIDAGLRSGTAVAFAPTGGQVDVSFECADPSLPAESPRPLDLADGDGPGLEVFAILRQGDAERIVGLAAPVDGEVSCPAFAAVDDAVLVSAAGGDELGAVGGFELHRDGNLVVRVAAVTYTAEGAEVSAAADGSSGTFAAVADDGTSIDGAFRCS